MALPPRTEALRPSSPRILLLTGERGAGKSTLCERLAREARTRGIPAGGIVCPGVFDPAGVKLGCRARDIHTGQEWPLGSREQDLGGPRWKAWSFSPEGFRRANQAVAGALGQGIGLVLIDEIGPVELTRGAGLEPSLRLLDARPESGPGTDPAVILVVRPELLADLSARYPGSDAESVSASDREETFRRVSDWLFA